MGRDAQADDGGPGQRGGGATAAAGRGSRDSLDAALIASIGFPPNAPLTPTTPAQALRKGYQKRLDDEREAALRYKGENGIFKKKFSVLMREVDDNKDEIKARREGLDALRRTIDGLEKEIGMLR